MSTVKYYELTYSTYIADVNFLAITIRKWLYFFRKKCASHAKVCYENKSQSVVGWGRKSVDEFAVTDLTALTAGCEKDSGQRSDGGDT